MKDTKRRRDAQERRTTVLAAFRTLLDEMLAAKIAEIERTLPLRADLDLPLVKK
jgi:hypothetical protein